MSLIRMGSLQSPAGGEGEEFIIAGMGKHKAFKTTHLHPFTCKLQSSKVIIPHCHLPGFTPFSVVAAYIH